MKQTAVEYLIEQLNKKGYLGTFCTKDIIEFRGKEIESLINQSKEMENNRATEYAEFCIRCDRAGLPLVQFEDWLDGLTFKPE